jgi:hypothetical protein
MLMDAQDLGYLLWGPLAHTQADSLTITAMLGDLSPRFLPKGRVGPGYRALARNGRVLLASDTPLAELNGKVAEVRVQTWHRAILPGDKPKPYGLLLSVRKATSECRPSHIVALIDCTEEHAAEADLVLDVGGGTVLAFRVVREA